MKNYNNFLLEFRSRGTLYHLFDLEKLVFILKNNSLEPKNFANISTTRNKNMIGYLGDKSTTLFKLELDGDKLSNNYKIKPFQYKTIDAGYLEEWEEVIKTHKISDINKYTKKFIILKDNVERLKNSGWFDSDGGLFIKEGSVALSDFKTTRATLPDIFKEYIPKIKKLFGDNIYVQESTVIKKDDKWIDSIINYTIKQVNHGYALYYRKHREEFKFNTNILVDYVEPINKKNKELDKFVIGYDYEDLYLEKNSIWLIKTEYEKYKQDDKNKLYEFDYEYDKNDIISEYENIVHVKIAKLDDTKPLW